MDRIYKFIHRRLSHFALLFFYVVGAYVYWRRNNFEIVGRENVPKGVGILFLPNHLDLTDSWGVGISAYRFRDLVFHYARIPWNAPDKGNFSRNRIYRFVFGLLKNVLVVRGGRSQKAIYEQIDSIGSPLKDSNLVLFFEGTRSRDGSIGPCRSGVQLVIQRAKPNYVIPVRIVIEDGKRVLPLEHGFDWSKIARNVRGKIIIGKPMIFTEEELANRKLIGKRVQSAVIALHP